MGSRLHRDAAGRRPRLRSTERPDAGQAGAAQRAGRPALTLALLCLALTAATVLALTLGRDAGGDWSFAWSEAFAALSRWRVPRSLAAFCAGAMLGVAGTILQRLLRNPMASPEVLGVSAGAALGVVALGALLDALVGALTASGDPRAMLLLNWMMGSTYAVDEAQLAWAAGSALLLVALAAPGLRWLDLIALGDAAGIALGRRLPMLRLLLLLLAAALTAAATLVVGPLTFVGLMTPHLSRLLGLQYAAPQLAASALGGALVMVLADWLGRVVAFPWQMPAGLIATLIGGPVLIALLARR